MNAGGGYAAGSAKIKILDVGCGDRYITDRIKKECYDIIGIDSRDSKNCKWITRDPDFLMDATRMEFKNNSFDVVIALEIIEHCDCLSEIRRVLKPGGTLFCSTPAPSTDWVRKVLIFFRILRGMTE